MELMDVDGNYMAEMIGSDEDFKKREVQRKEAGDSFSKMDNSEGTSIRRVNLMRSGFHAGYEAAASDYVNDKATVEHFDRIRTERDLTDFYAIGFELGYFRKLSEILVG